MAIKNTKNKDIPVSTEMSEPESERHLDQLQTEKDLPKELEQTSERERHSDSESTGEDENQQIKQSGVVKPTQQVEPTEALEEDETISQVEHILEEDLGPTFASLDAQHQQLFKKKGEETAKAINSLLGHAKVKVQKIFELIKAWLMIIPGINKWFVIQESKIKVDKIIKLKHKD